MPFTLNLSSYNVECLKESIWAFITLAIFGGLGARSRRGAGSIRIKDISLNNGNADIENEFNMYRKLLDTEEIATKEKLKEHLEIFTSNTLKTLSNVCSSSYSSLTGSRVYLMNPESNWKEALESSGQAFAEFRGKVKGRVNETPNFGFPILHRSSNPSTLMFAGKKSGSKDFLERRASPLIFKVIKTNENTYFPIIIWLNGELIPPGYQIMDKKGKNTSIPQDSIIQEFLDTIDKKLEVRL